MKKPLLNLPNRGRSTLKYPRHMSLYVDIPVQSVIKEIAAEYDCKPHDVVIAALDMLFKKAGRPSVKELTGVAELRAPSGSEPNGDHTPHNPQSKTADQFAD